MRGRGQRPRRRGRGRQRRDLGVRIRRPDVIASGERRPETMGRRDGEVEDRGGGGGMVSSEAADDATTVTNTKATTATSATATTKASQHRQYIHRQQQQQQKQEDLQREDVWPNDQPETFVKLFVSECRIIRDRHTGGHRGCAFVTYRGGIGGDGGAI